MLVFSDHRAGHGTFPFVSVAPPETSDIGKLATARHNQRRPCFLVERSLWLSRTPTCRKSRSADRPQPDYGMHTGVLKKRENGSLLG